eukprot:scaffold103843_cov72-Phaeocystis_antarctica.AAC.1
MLYPWWLPSILIRSSLVARNAMLPLHGLLPQRLPLGCELEPEEPANRARPREIRCLVPTHRLVQLPVNRLVRRAVLAKFVIERSRRG